MQNLAILFAIAVSMNAGVALAQKDNTPEHDKMPPGDHAEHDKKKTDGDADKEEAAAVAHNRSALSCVPRGFLATAGRRKCHRSLRLCPHKKLIADGQRSRTSGPSPNWRFMYSTEQTATGDRKT